MTRPRDLLVLLVGLAGPDFDFFDRDHRSLPDSACVPCGTSPAGRLDLYAGDPCPTCGAELVTMAEACAAPSGTAPPPEGQGRGTARNEGGGRVPSRRKNLHEPGDLVNHEQEKLNREIAEAETRRWRGVSVRLLAFLANLSEIRGAGVVARELNHGWFCLACGMSGQSPTPPECPMCRSGEDGARQAPMPGHAAALHARELVRGTVQAPPPQEFAAVPAESAPDGRNRIEIVRFCPKCRGECPPEATEPTDCPTCHGEGL